MCKHHNFPSGGAYNFDLNNRYMVTYCADSLYVGFWNIAKREFMKSLKLENCPVVVKFSQTNLLAVGTCLGTVEFFELGDSLSTVQRGDKLNYNEAYQPCSIKFSSNDKRVAVCYKKKKEPTQEEDSSEFVLCVYEQFLKNEKHCIKVSNDEHKFINDFHFSASGERMIIFYSEADGLAHPFKKTDFSLVIYDLTKRTEKKELGEEDFNQINFSVAVEAYYSEYPELIVFEADSESENKQLPNARVTAMAQYDKSTIMGTQNGEIFVIKSEEFLMDLESSTDKEQKVFVDFLACSPNPIRKMHAQGDLLFVSCENESGIICYRLEKEAAQMPEEQK